MLHLKHAAVSKQKIWHIQENLVSQEFVLTGCVSVLTSEKNRLPLKPVQCLHWPGNVTCFNCYKVTFYMRNCNLKSIDAMQGWI